MEPEVTVDADPVSLGALERQLEGAEEAGGAGDSNRDEAELAQDLLPAFASDPGRGGELMEDLGELDLAMGRELDRLSQGVDEPAEDDLAGSPASVALEELLQSWLFAS